MVWAHFEAIFELAETTSLKFLQTSFGVEKKSETSLKLKASESLLRALALISSLICWQESFDSWFGFKFPENLLLETAADTEEYKLKMGNAKRKAVVVFIIIVFFMFLGRKTDGVSAPDLT